MVIETSVGCAILHLLPFFRSEQPQCSQEAIDGLSAFAYDKL